VGFESRLGYCFIHDWGKLEEKDKNQSWGELSLRESGRGEKKFRNENWGIEGEELSRARVEIWTRISHWVIGKEGKSRKDV